VRDVSPVTVPGLGLASASVSTGGSVKPSPRSKSTVMRIGQVARAVVAFAEAAMSDSEERGFVSISSLSMSLCAFDRSVNEKAIELVGGIVPLL